MDPGVLCGTLCRRSAAGRGPREDVDVDLRERKDLNLIPSGSTVSSKASDIQYFLRDIFPGTKHLLHLRSPFSVKIREECLLNVLGNPPGARVVFRCQKEAIEI